ncbi:MAG TPA: HEAT repeat domain-containing protein [Pirellulales bacterium]|nr:HEAT repeat domain-containing protein [Pirellulales bacterium]
MAAQVLAVAWALSGSIRPLRADEIVSGRSIGAWLRILQDRHSTDRDLAIQALSEVGAKDPRVVPALAAAVTDPLYGSFAIAALGRFGPSANQAVPTLSAIMLRHPVTSWRIIAADALWQIAKSPACIDVLIHILDDPDKIVRSEAAAALGRIGSPAKKATPRLLRALGDQAAVRITAVEALGQIRAEPRAAVPALAKALRDPWPLVRTNAAKALACFGGEATNAIPALERASKDIDANLRVEAAYALWCIDKRQDALRRLYSALARFDFETEGAACIAIRRLADIGRENEDVAPRLMEFLNHGHPLKVEIAMALWDLNRRPEAVAALTAALEDEQFVIRRVAARALETLGSDARSAVPALLKALARTPDQEQFVPEISPDDPPALVEPNTQSVFESCRLEAWMALQKIDPAAASRYHSQHPDSVRSLAPHD